MIDPLGSLLEWLQEHHPMVFAEFINTIYPGDEEE